MSHLTANRAQTIVAQVTRDDDGAHALELMELINGVADRGNGLSEEVLKSLYLLTDDFEKHFQDFVSRL